MTVVITYDGHVPTIGADADVWGAEINNQALGPIKDDLDNLAVQSNADNVRIGNAESNITVLQQGLLTGEIRFGLWLVAPAGWVKANGGTIGSAASGGTARANADAQSLFVMIWTNVDATDAPIQTSAGTPTTRGASAVADFAANKRLTIPDMRAMFPRGLDDSRGVDVSRRIASYQADDLESHQHLISPPTASGEGGQGATTTGTLGGGETVTPYNSGSTGGSETRPMNIALTAILKL